jgi:hypothetical protein
MAKIAMSMCRKGAYSCRVQDRREYATTMCLDAAAQHDVPSSLSH